MSSVIIFLNKGNSLKLGLLMCVLISFAPAKAQPGWQDLTERYSYTILNEIGKEISFKDNNNYSIMIDSVLYKAPNIPQDPLIPATENSQNFNIQICINDFSLDIPAKNTFDECEERLEIKIIDEKDTMFICQSSGTGSFWNTKNKIGLQNDGLTEPPADFRLQFIPGHYYFPYWAIYLLNEVPKTYGNIKILNMDQAHFIVPKAIYDSIYFNRNKYNRSRNYYAEAENMVVDNFAKGNFMFTRTIQPTTFDKSIVPFRNPRWSYWGKPYYATSHKDEYIGITEFSYDTLNWSGGRGAFVRFNRNENKMSIWSATNKILYSSTYKLKHDPYNNVYYNQTIIRDSSCKDFIFNCDFETKLFRSTDEGHTWTEDITLTQLYKKHPFRELEFIDQNYALIFVLDKMKAKKKKYDIQQGKYYLLKNFHIVDSFITPSDIHYNDNYNGYRYNVKNDTISLGAWTNNAYAETGKTYFQLFIYYVDNKWKFQVVDLVYLKNKIDRQEIDTIIYQNFKIVSNNELVFKDQGSLVFKNGLFDLQKKGLILENGKQIYIIGLGIGTILSFDGGISWYIYPLPLEKDSRYEFLELDEKGVISHLKNSWENNGYGFYKIYNQFLKIE